MKSTKLLTSDHEIILRSLHIMDKIVCETQEGKEVDNDDIRSLLDFSRDFTDGCHHVKEEAIFFPALVQAGMSLQEGPLRVIGYEHERGRALTAAMEDSLEHHKKEDFLMYARRYIQLLTEHIQKENNVLFDIADRTLSDEEDEKVADAFEQFETHIVGTQAHERLQGVIESLSSKYLPVVV